MNAIQDRIEEIKTNGYELDFGTVFENAFENYKKIAIYAGLMLIVFSVLFGAILIGILTSIFGLETLTNALEQGKLRPEILTGNFLLIYTGSIILITCITSPFQAGFLKMADCGEKDEEFHVSTIFEYYKMPYLGSIFSATLIITVLSSGLSLLLQSAGIQMVGVLTSVTLSLFTYLTIPLIVFGKLNALEAITASISIILKQPFLILGLLIVAGIASIVGIIGICIGIFFTIPFVYSMSYTVYHSIIGNQDKNNI